MTAAVETLTYLTAYADETMPCLPRLEAWAAWLAKPDPEWNRPEAAEDGAEFEGWQADVLGDVRAEWTPGGWKLTPAPPEGSAYFYCRWHEGAEGWDVENSGQTPEAALEFMEADDGAIWLACTSADRRVRVRFHVDGPRCEVIDDPPEACLACAVPFVAGDQYLADISGGAIYFACCGPEPEGFVNLDTGEPLPAPPQPMIWGAD